KRSARAPCPWAQMERSCQAPSIRSGDVASAARAATGPAGSSAAVVEGLRQCGSSRTPVLQQPRRCALSRGAAAPAAATSRGWPRRSRSSSSSWRSSAFSRATASTRRSSPRPRRPRSRSSSPSRRPRWLLDIGSRMRRGRSRSLRSGSSSARSRSRRSSRGSPRPPSPWQRRGRTWSTTRRCSK
ncbi:unnamed protein product, partial [Prorocentrum cordatum]